MIMMNGSSYPKVVKAIYNFKASNNDELCFSKGDVIKITQVLDGGWWEGTLNGLTGWFPSNYVKDIKVQELNCGVKNAAAKSDSVCQNLENSHFYRDVVVQSLIETERAFVNDLQLLLQNYMRPLQSANGLTSAEYHDLCGNLEELTSINQALLNSLNECLRLSVHQQRVGGVFMKMAPQIQNCYHSYCAKHPKAIVTLQIKRDELSEFMESRGAPAPGIAMLATSLSKPFLRLDKYSGLLKELERHTEESHVDRGDIQRAIFVYRDMATECSDIRRRNEMEQEILKSHINGLDGEDLSKFGEILLLSPMRVHFENGDKKEQLMLLFPSVIIVLSVSPRVSGYTVEDKLLTGGLKVNILDDTEEFSNAFEIIMSPVDKRILSCGTSQECKRWVDALRLQSKQLPISAKLNQSGRQQISTNSCQSGTLSSPYNKMTPSQNQIQQFRPQQKGPWSVFCLRPSPPVRPFIVNKEDGKGSPRPDRRILGRRKQVEDAKILEEDALILKVIEAYCTSAKARQTVNSLLLDCPQVLIAEDEKIIIEEMKGDQTIVEEKTLVDTVYSMKDQVVDLRQEMERVKKELEDERKARKKLENLIRVSLKSHAVECSKDVDNILS